MSFRAELYQKASLYKYTATGDFTPTNDPVSSQVYSKEINVRVAPASTTELRVELEAVIRVQLFYTDEPDINERDTLVFSGDTYNILSVETYYDPTESVFVLMCEKVIP